MNKSIKKILFASLLCLFLIFTILVDTIGTEEDKGAAFLTPSAKDGKLLFQKYNCTACHQLYGLGGYMGPDLTNLMSTPGKGESYAKAFLMTGTKKMPDFRMSDKEADCLVAYLKYVDKTGISPVKHFDFNTDGTISILK